MRYDPPIPATPEQIQRVVADIILAKDEELSIKELQGINAAIDVFFEKVNRRKRSLANYRKLAATEVRKLAPAVNEWMKLMIGELQKGLTQVKGRKAKLVPSRLADWKHVKEQGEIILKPVILSVLAAGGDAVVRRKIIKQERFDPIGTEAVKWAEEHAAELVVGITKETMDAIRTYIIAGINAGKSIPKLARELRPLVGLTERQIMAVANYHEKIILERPEYTAARQRAMADTYAKRLHRKRATLIARTETKNALWEGTFQGYGQMGIKRVEGVSGPGACDWCIDNIDGKVYTIREARGVAAESHPGCVLGNTRILAPGIKTGFSGYYKGPIIRIAFAGGDISVTPNHMFLTPKGFARAASLRKRDKIFYSFQFEREMSGHPNNNGKPPMIEQIVASFAKTGGMTTRTMKVSAKYFHGDGAFMNGNVDIIAPDGFLKSNSKPKISELFAKDVFTSFDSNLLPLSGNGNLASTLFSLLDTTGSGMGSRHESLAFSRRTPLPYKFPDFASSPAPDAGHFESPLNNIPTNTKALSDFILRFPRDITMGDVLDGDVVFNNRLGSPDFHPSDYKPPLDSIPADSKLLSNLIQAFSREISTLDVLDIKVIFHDKPIKIYDLETFSSLYIANGLISSNCACAWVAAA